MLCCVISLQLEHNVEQGKVYSKADLSNGNGTVWYLAVNAHSFGPINSTKGGGGGGLEGAGSENLCLYFASSI